MNTREMLLTGLTGMTWIALAMPLVSGSEAADVVAINVLAVPDASMRDRARRLNEQLGQHHPQPFTFDETHTPHISVLHRFVAANDLPSIFAAVEGVAAKHRLAGTTLRTAGLERSAWGDAELISIKVAKTPELAALQAELVAALRPLATPRGGHDAFVTSPGPAEIDAQTIEYVQTFEQKQTGDRFKPHITAGETDRAIEDKLPPFPDTTFTVETLAIYQLGNSGTARKELWRAAN
jgi:2'-5' RNA ligase